MEKERGRGKIAGDEGKRGRKRGREGGGREGGREGDREGEEEGGRERSNGGNQRERVRQ